MDESFAFRDESGDEIAAVLSMPDAGNGRLGTSRGVVLLHCFTCTKHHRIMRNLAESLCGRGIAALRFDFSGNGESGGKIEDSTYTKMVREVGEAVSALRERGVEKIGVAGHSMGAMLSVLSAHEDRRIGAVAFIAGSSQAARVREVFPKESVEKAEKDGESQAFVYGRDIVLKREFLLDVEKFNIGHAVATLKRPLLIVHGSEDEIIHPYHARQLYHWASGPKELKVMQGADHLFRKEEHLGALKETVSGWFAKNL
ncbi:MAG: alpha/beta fold hydrolase [Candidatus Micrarchaeota archaeon]